MKKTFALLVALAVVAVSAVAMAVEPAQQTAEAQSTGAQTWPSAALDLAGLQAPGAEASAQAALAAIPGVQNVKIDATTNQAWIWYDQTATSPSAIAEAFNTAQTQVQASLPQSKPAAY